MAYSRLLQLASDYPPYTVAFETMDPDTGFRRMVTRGLAGFCGYVGVPAQHVSADMADLAMPRPLELTFQQWGQPTSKWAPGFFWRGWDYQHAEDIQDSTGYLLHMGVTDPDILRLAESIDNHQGIRNGGPRAHTLDEVIECTVLVAAAFEAQTNEAEASSLRTLNRLTRQRC